MAFDEKRLAGFEKWATECERFGNMAPCHPQDVLEFVRMYRLGLWAKEHGIKAVTTVEQYWRCTCEFEDARACSELADRSHDAIEGALAAIPKDGT
jgi:hypothetical protein